MPTHLTIENTSIQDLPFIFGLFDQSIEYQERKGYPVWRNYDKNAIRRDQENGNQYKAVIDGSIGIVFSVAYRDKILWREMDTGESIYLHRIVVNPLFKGRKLFGVVLTWAIDHLREKGLRSIRMDTWAADHPIIGYYKTFGFEVVEEFITPDSPELPAHNRNLALALLEYRGTI
jgi:GNAT superfamily N-acetyltransferase